VQHGLALRATARSDGLITVHAAGVLDNNTLDRFEAALAKARERGAKSVVVDCEEVRYVSSAGFGELIRYHDLLKENGGVLVLARVAPKVGVILEMLGLKSLIPVVASLEEAIRIAERGEVPEPARPPDVNRVSVAPPRERLPVEPRIAAELGARPVPLERPASAEPTAAECIFCDARLPSGAPGSRSTCAACGAPYEVAESGGLRFEWGEDEGACDAFHLTFHMTPHGMAALAGMIEAMLADREVEHVPTRRFSRDVVQVCLLISEHAYAADERGLLHLLAVSTPERLALRVVDRGRDLTAEAGAIFESQASRLLDFEYGRLAEGVQATRFAFAWPAGESEPG
jgi:anti-sigma B factor antagonist